MTSRGILGLEWTRIQSHCQLVSVNKLNMPDQRSQRCMSRSFPGTLLFEVHMISFKKHFLLCSLTCSLACFRVKSSLLLSVLISFRITLKNCLSKVTHSALFIQNSYSRYLGFQLENYKVRPQMDKVEAVCNCPRPHTKKEACSFP